MRAVVVTEPGGPEVLRVMEVADPEPGPDEIRVRVGHSACNRADIMQRLGGYPDPVRREHLVALMDDEVGALGDDLEFVVGDERRDLDDDIGGVVEAGHLEIHPHQHRLDATTAARC